MNYTTTGAKKRTQIPQRHRDLGVDRAERERAFKGAAEEDRRRDAFESLAVGLSSASAGALTEKPRWERLLDDEIRATDARVFDDFGEVRP